MDITLSWIMEILCYDDVFSLDFFLVFRGFVHITGETLTVSSLRRTPTLPKGMGVTLIGIRALGS